MDTVTETASNTVSKKENLLWVVLGTIFISTVMVMASFIVFLNSGAYNTIKQISAAQTVLQDDLDDIDTTSTLKADELQDYANTLPQRVKILNDYEDFGPINF